MRTSTERKRRGSRWAAIGNGLLEFLYRRAAFLMLTGVLLVLGFFAWRMVMAVVGYRSPSNLTGVEQVVDGKFLGVAVRDRTRDGFMGNVWLRMALHDGFRTAHVLRRHQIGEFWLREIRYPQTGAAAVEVFVQPMPNDHPLPPFEPILVRKWQPPPGITYDARKLAELQRSLAPHAEDLLKLRQNISAGRYQDFESLVTSVRRGMLFVMVGVIAIVVGGAYRCRAFLTTRSDTMTDLQRDQSALHSMQAARREQYERQQLDARR